MSYTIEYARKVLKLSKGTKVKAGFGKIEHQRHENDYFLFIKEGCNNLYPRPEEWCFHAAGWNYQIIAKICERAAWTESGCLKMTSGDTTPEAYLRRYRKEIAEAPEFSITALRASTGIHSGYICLGNKNGAEEWISREVEELKQFFTVFGPHYEYFRYDISLNTEEQFLAFIHYSNLATRTGGYAGVQSIQNKNGF
jgi:hypothetical protein